MRRLPGHLLTWMLAVAVLLAGMGVGVAPIRSVSQAAGDSDEWFPCKWHGCGCVNAEMCRTNCCCLKPAAPSVAAKPAVKSCCHAEEPSEGHATGKAATAGTRGVELIIQSAGCAGRNGSLLLTVAFWVAPLPAYVIRHDRLPGRIGIPRAYHWETTSSPPDPPPPRA